MNTDTEDRTELITPSIETPEQETHSKSCGHLEIALLYDAPMRKMTVDVLQARNVQCRDRSQSTHTQVRIKILLNYSLNSLSKYR